MFTTFEILLRNVSARKKYTVRHDNYNYSCKIISKIAVPLDLKKNQFLAYSSRHVDLLKVSTREIENFCKIKNASRKKLKRDFC
jgi:hypothetical protein